jgi:DNA mismatch repair ATPase MutS
LIDPVRHLDDKLYAFAAVFRRLERESFTTPYLAQLRAALDLGGKPASEALAWLGRLVRRLHTAPLFFTVLGTTRVALALDAWRKRFGPTLARWQVALGELDALNALAGYAFENPQDPFPDVTAGAPFLDGVGLGHPLLPRDRCVGNDVRLGGDLNVLVVSGSNMSGKSTWLRTIGANAVLALAGAPVRAVHLRLSPLAIGATLRIQDSLQAGRSRFQAEVRRIRKLLEMAQGKTPLLFLLDELFQGTNSNDRRIGAEALVRQLLASGAIGMVTTHDLALTEFADHPANRGTNVHFVDKFEDGVMTFDYRLRPGVVPKSNALALLRAVGITV